MFEWSGWREGAGDFDRCLSGQIGGRGQGILTGVGVVRLEGGGRGF